MDQVSALYNLQEIDSEILTYTHRLNNPAHASEIAELKEQLTKMMTQIKRGMAEKETLVAELKRAEEEIANCQVRIDEINKVCQSCSDHRFLLEARDEISLLEKRIDKLSFNARPIREKIGQYTQVIEASAHNVKAKHGRYIALQEKDRAMAQELKREIEALQIEREHEAARIEEETLDRYESSREKHHGIGLARLTDEGACSACKMSFPEGIILRLRRGTIFTECPNCHRFMIVEEALDD